jgi:hypothetical protein
MKIPEWLVALENQLRQSWAPVCDELQSIAPTARVSVSSNTWGQATGANGYSIHLCCFWPSRRADEVDDVTLSLSFLHVDSTPSVSMDVCWGHPSGFVEAEMADTWVPFSDEVTARLFEEMPRLSDSLRNAIRRGKPEK